MVNDYRFGQNDLVNYYHSGIPRWLIKVIMEFPDDISDTTGVSLIIVLEYDTPVLIVCTNFGVLVVHTSDWTVRKLAVQYKRGCYTIADCTLHWKAY